MVGLFRFFSVFPLWLLQGMGAVAGWATYLLAPSYRRRWNDNRAQAGLTAGQVRGAVAHAGRMIFELPRLWLGRPVPYRWTGLEHVERAYGAHKGIVFLTPHMGCFEITAQAMAETFGPQYGDLTVMYRPARQKALADMMVHVRNRPHLRTVTTTLTGVRQMIKVLRKGEAVGVLPDHVPPEGQGVWAPFFGRPAYTMTLATKLVQQTGAEVIVIWGERLSWGRGYVLHCSPLSAPMPEGLEAGVAHINHEMERLILSDPNQYMWSYARYRRPRGQPEPARAATAPAPEGGTGVPPQSGQGNGHA